MDKNMSVLCAEHLNASIREFCAVKMREESLDDDSEVKISLNEIIDKVKEEFGYYLPHLLLKRSKKIKRVRFERLLDDKYRIQDTLIIKAADYS